MLKEHCLIQNPTLHRQWGRRGPQGCKTPAQEGLCLQSTPGDKGQLEWEEERGCTGVWGYFWGYFSLVTAP